MMEYYSPVIPTELFLMWMLECKYRIQKTMKNFLQNFEYFKIISYKYIYLYNELNRKKSFCIRIWIELIDFVEAFRRNLTNFKRELDHEWNIHH